MSPETRNDTMSRTLGRALTRLSLGACALVVLAAIGQPLPSPTLAQSPAEVLTALERMPLTARLFGKDAEKSAADAACEAESATAAAAVSDAAAQALARSALRMRWLLTSPSASGRSCGAAGCTG